MRIRRRKVVALAVSFAGPVRCLPSLRLPALNAAGHANRRQTGDPLGKLSVLQDQDAGTATAVATGTATAKLAPGA
jgi:hypothetical protein